jgi:hypothetical protein
MIRGMDYFKGHNAWNFVAFDVNMENCSTSHARRINCTRGDVDIYRRK